jgi:hypothetical protein
MTFAPNTSKNYARTLVSWRASTRSTLRTDEPNFKLMSRAGLP